MLTIYQFLFLFSYYIFSFILQSHLRFQDHGYKEGYSLGERSGFEQGRQTGHVKGREVGAEIGFYAGFAAMWKAVLQKQQDKPKPRYWLYFFVGPYHQQVFFMGRGSPIWQKIDQRPELGPLI